MTEGPSSQYASRAGLKLEAALREFRADVSGRVCADFGCHAGGFTDCLLVHGAARVYAVDPSYGVLAWRLRQDPRVVVMERTNALHADPPEPVDWVTIDVGWTRQALAIPAALRWLAPGGQIITLLKPHYEAVDDEGKARLDRGMLAPADAEAVRDRVLASFPALGVTVVSWVVSPITGVKSARRNKGEGNREYLVLARRSDATEPPAKDPFGVQ